MRVQRASKILDNRNECYSTIVGRFRVTTPLFVSALQMRTSIIEESIDVLIHRE